jgi:alcohol dehydrogenase YqhD (iron-dependent ADH family)
MDKFIYQNPTKVYFGLGAVRDLGTEVKQYADKVLLVYGRSSARKNWSYTAVKQSLSEKGIAVYELKGICPNPVISFVAEGARLCKEKGLKAVVAVGGGSVIDCAKVIAAAACYPNDPWDFLSGKQVIETALPIFVALTLAATGSELDNSAVITNDKTGEKFDVGSPWLLPRASFLDPSYTYSVDAYQTACGVADIMSHIMEQYFGDLEGSYMQDRIAEGMIKTCLHFGPIALKKPNDYEARANLMWVSSWAEEGLLDSGHQFPWVVHPLEHPLSGMNNITHGAGLAVLTPCYYRYVLNQKNAKRFAEFFENTGLSKPKRNDPTKIKEAEDGIKALEDFFYKDLQLPKKLRLLKVNEGDFPAMADQALRGEKAIGSFAKLTRKDILAIYKMAY